MHFHDFDLKDIPLAGKRSAWLDIADRDDGSAWRLPLLTVIGADAGSTLLVLAGVHGDEYEGIVAIPQIYSLIEPQELRGLPRVTAGDGVAHITQSYPSNS